MQIDALIEAKIELEEKLQDIINQQLLDFRKKYKDVDIYNIDITIRAWLGANQHIVHGVKVKLGYKNIQIG